MSKQFLYQIKISLRTDQSSRRSSLRPETNSHSCKQRGVYSASRYGIYYHPQYGELMLPTSDYKEIVKHFQSSYIYLCIYIYIPGMAKTFKCCRVCPVYIYIYTYVCIYIYTCKYIYVCYIHIYIDIYVHT